MEKAGLSKKHSKNHIWTSFTEAFSEQQLQTLRTFMTTLRFLISRKLSFSNSLKRSSRLFFLIFSSFLGETLHWLIIIFLGRIESNFKRCFRQSREKATGSGGGTRAGEKNFWKLWAFYFSAASRTPASLSKSIKTANQTRRNGEWVLFVNDL